MTGKVNIENEVRAAVARRVGALRKAQGLSFDALALASGISKGTLVQLEQERANPSIATLCRLAASLGVSVADLVTQPDAKPSPVSVVPKTEARTLWRGPKGGSAVLLAGTRGPDMLELWQWTLMAGESFAAEAHGRGTRELVHVTRGRLCLIVDGNETVVAAGATALAHTDRPHGYSNAGKTPLHFIMTVHEPSNPA